jgi:hypothetical protein
LGEDRTSVEVLRGEGGFSIDAELSWLIEYVSGTATGNQQGEDQLDEEGRGTGHVGEPTPQPSEVGDRSQVAGERGGGVFERVMAELRSIRDKQEVIIEELRVLRTFIESQRGGGT